MRIKSQACVCALIAYGLCATAQAVPQGYLYWSSNDTDIIYRANLDGSQPTSLLTGRMNPSNLVIAGERLYWSEQWVEGVGMTVRSANLDGSDPRILYSTFHNTTELAVNAATGDCFRVEYSSGIQRAQPGSYIERYICHDQNVFGICFDSTSQRLIWGTSIPQPARIRSSDPDGLHVRDLVTGLTGSVGDVELGGDYLYWIAGYGGAYRVCRARLDGTTTESVTALPLEARRLAIDATGGHIYVSDASGILRCGLDGTDLQRIQTAKYVLGMAVYYVPEPDCLLVFALGEMFPISRPGQRVKDGRRNGDADSFSQRTFSSSSKSRRF